MKIRKNKKGFTLVELVVVIAILAVLAGTATVATIAILNNARRAPVTDAADSLQNQMQLYVMDDAFTKDADGFKNYLAQTMPDLAWDGKNSVNKISSYSDSTGKMHVALVNNPSGVNPTGIPTDLKKNSWTIIVYSEYYQVRITYIFDTGLNGFQNFTVSDVKKLGENF